MFRCQGKEIIRVPISKNLKHLKPSSESVLTCDKCDASGWSSESEVILHEKFEHKEELLELVDKSSVFNPVCLVCLKKQPDLPLLYQHYKEIHLLSSPTARRVERELFICDICQQIFFNKSVLELHIFYKHDTKNDVYKFRCPLCLKQLQRKLLRPHLMSHQMCGLSCCPICLIKCDSRKVLLEHVAETHKKHLLCNVCGYSTTREATFHRHLDVCETQKLNGGIQYDMYFVTPRTKSMWRHSSINWVLNGLELYNSIFLCVLCRHLCYTKAESIDHIWRDHNHVMPTVKKTHKCNCGEVFLNAVLLKHHLFKVKEKGHFDVKDDFVDVVG